MSSLLLIVIAGGALAGFVQGLTGFAFGLVAMALWSWVLEPAVAGPLVVLCSIIGQTLGLRLLTLSALPRAVPFLLGGVIGVPAGVALLPMVEPRLFQGGLGALLLVWCPAMLLAPRLPRIRFGGAWGDALAGLLGGVMGGIGGLPGPIPILWCILRGWDRAAQRAVLQLVFLAMHLLTLAGYLISGTLTVAVWSQFLPLAPAVVVTSLLGVAAYRRLGDRGFQRLVLGLLAASGVAMLLSALR
jgi:uncharacterized membrane protein YfcA